MITVKVQVSEELVSHAELRDDQLRKLIEREIGRLGYDAAAKLLKDNKRYTVAPWAQAEFGDGS